MTIYKFATTGHSSTSKSCAFLFKKELVKFTN